MNRMRFCQADTLLIWEDDSLTLSPATCRCTSARSPLCRSVSHAALFSRFAAQHTKPAHHQYHQSVSQCPIRSLQQHVQVVAGADISVPCANYEQLMRSDF